MNDSYINPYFMSYLNSLAIQNYLNNFKINSFLMNQSLLFLKLQSNNFQAEIPASDNIHLNQFLRLSQSTCTPTTHSSVSAQPCSFSSLVNKSGYQCPDVIDANRPLNLFVNNIFKQTNNENFVNHIIQGNNYLT